MPNNGGLYSWSQTANNNANADNTVNWAEGQSPSTINDSARSMMASAAKYRDDLSGMLLTSGTSTAYILASNQDFDSLSDMHQKEVWFSPHVTSGATVTLLVDGLGAKPLRSSPGVELSAGVLIEGTPYGAIFNNTDGAFYLKGYYGNPLSVPFLSGMDYWDTVTPNSSFIFPAGQAISRTTYATAFARWGTKYGVGDGSTTFNVPDKTGRVSAMVEATATRLTTAGGGVDGATIGAAGGLQNETLLTANLPPYTPAGSIAGSIVAEGGTSTALQGSGGAFPVMVANGTGNQTNNNTALIAIVDTLSLSMTAQGGTSTPVKTLPPLIVCNYIIRIL